MESETVAAWGFNLEEILSRVTEQSRMSRIRVNLMLCSVFYEGLCPVLRDIAGYKFDMIQFDSPYVALNTPEDYYRRRVPSLSLKYRWWPLKLCLLHLLTMVFQS